MRNLKWREFETLIFRIFQSQGFTCELGPGSNDGGIDVRMLQRDPLGDILTLVQVKKYAAGRKIDQSAVAALHGVADVETAQRSIFVTTSEYLPSARKFAGRTSIPMTLATSRDVRDWCKTATDGIVRDKSKLVTPSALSSCLQSLLPKDPRIIHAHTGYSMILNQFALILKETKYAALIMALPSRTISDDGYGQTGFEIPDIGPECLTRLNAETVFRAKRQVHDGRVSYWNGRELYSAWNGEAAHFSFMSNILGIDPRPPGNRIDLAFDIDRDVAPAITLRQVKATHFQRMLKCLERIRGAPAILKSLLNGSRVTLSAKIRKNIAVDAHVTLTDVTSAYAVLALMGPKSRDILARLTSTDLSNEGFPFATIREIDVGYATAYANRMTYVGELGWELIMPTEFAVGVYEALHEAGRDFGLLDCGYYALEALRLEKGYRAWSRELTPDVTPYEAGLGFAVSLDKPGGFIGREALAAAKAKGALSRRVVQFTVEDSEPMLWGGELILCDGTPVGEVRSAAYGHTLGCSVAMALIDNPAGVDRAFLETGRFEVELAGDRFAVMAHLAPAYDPNGLRVKA